MFILKKIAKRTELIDLDGIVFHVGYDTGTLIKKILDRDLDKGYYEIEVTFKEY